MRGGLGICSARPAHSKQWSHDAFEGATREPENKWDSEEYRVKREEEKRRREKALAVERAAERAANLKAIEKDVEEKAQKRLQLQVSALNREKEELATKREEAQKQLKKAGELRSATAAKDRAAAAQSAQIAEMELQAAMAVSLKQAAAEGQKASGGALACALEDSDRECVVCLAEPKCMLLEPCKHVCLCVVCFEKIMAVVGEP